jgi:hypothetical protein
MITCPKCDEIFEPKQKRCQECLECCPFCGFSFDPHCTAIWEDEPEVRINPLKLTPATKESDKALDPSLKTFKSIHKCYDEMDAYIDDEVA